jgi:hypothetical protein
LKLKWLLIPVFALAVIAGILYLAQPQDNLTAELSFRVEMPTHMVAGKTENVKVYVVNHGNGTARKVELLAKSESFRIESGSFDLRPGEERTFKAKITALDVQDATYEVAFRLSYTSNGKQQYTKPIVKQVRILPAVEIADIRWETDLFNLLGKSTIGRGDQTTLYFKVKSLSEKIIYSGIVAKVSLPLEPPGLKITPQEISIEDLGPKGETSEYHFKVVSEETPPGQYQIVIQLYTQDGVALPGTGKVVKVTVSP